MFITIDILNYNYGILIKDSVLHGTLIDILNHNFGQEDKKYLIANFYDSINKQKHFIPSGYSWCILFNDKNDAIKFKLLKE